MFAQLLQNVGLNQWTCLQCQRILSPSRALGILKAKWSIMSFNRQHHHGVTACSALLDHTSDCGAGSPRIEPALQSSMFFVKNHSDMQAFGTG